MAISLGPLGCAIEKQREMKKCELCFLQKGYFELRLESTFARTRL
jgi:hypothetical protein